MDEYFPPMELIRLSPREREEYEKNKARENKRVRKLRAEAMKRAKRSTCFICGKKSNSFCNSHSVPKFCLKRISSQGRVYQSGLQKEFPVLGDDKGVANAGTFQIICTNCDNTAFQEYEDPSAYDKEPSSIMLAQIAMKNYLHLLAQRYLDREVQSIIKDKSNTIVDRMAAESKLFFYNLDIANFQEGFQRAKLATNGNHKDWYNLLFFAKLDYVVPIAHQTAITLISDFKDSVINNIYHQDPEYKIRCIHIAIFPLQNETAIIVFVDNKDKRYRGFCKQFSELSFEDKLAALNYIIFSYEENVFMTKNEKIDEALNNREFLNVCQRTTNARLDYSPEKALEVAVSYYSLSKMHSIPNLLSREYALSSD